MEKFTLYSASQLSKLLYDHLPHEFSVEEYESGERHHVILLLLKKTTESFRHDKDYSELTHLIVFCNNQHNYICHFTQSKSDFGELEFDNKSFHFEKYNLNITK